MSEAKLFTNKSVVSLSEGEHRDPKCTGLVVRVRGGSRQYQLVYFRDGKTSRHTLGNVGVMDLAEARSQASSLRVRVKAGEDIKAAPKPARAATFRDDALLFHDFAKGGWVAEHAAQWLAAMENHVFPLIGKIDTAKVSVDHVKAVLEPHWANRHPLAIRLNGQIRQTIDYAAECDDDNARGFGRNPAGKVLRRLPTGCHHDQVPHPTICWKEAPALYKRLAAMQDTQPAKALQLLLLCACPRADEINGLKWSEVTWPQDVEPGSTHAGALHIPGERMKAKRTEKRAKARDIPLIPPAVELLQSLPFSFRGITGKEGLVFRGRKGKTIGATGYYGRDRRPIGGTFVEFSGGMHKDAMQNLLRDMYGRDETGTAKVHVHGLRATFRTWVQDNTTLASDWDVAESCLGHKIASKIQRSYARSDLMNERRALQERWAAFLMS